MKKKFSQFEKLTVVLVALIVILQLYIMFSNDGGIESVHRNLMKDPGLVDFENQYPRLTLLTQDMIEGSNNRLIEKAKDGDYLAEYVGGTVLYRPSSKQIIHKELVVVVPDDFYLKLYSHEQVANFKDLNPIVLPIRKSNFETLKEQIIGLNDSFIGDYILNYNTFLIIYDYNDDIIKTVVPLTNTPKQVNFLDKLHAHADMEDVRNEIPEGGRLDEATVTELKSQNPVVYEKAQAGDYLLRYQKRLVIYDFENDVIKANYVIQ